MRDSKSEYNLLRQQRQTASEEGTQSRETCGVFRDSELSCRTSRGQECGVWEGVCAGWLKGKMEGEMNRCMPTSGIWMSHCRPMGGLPASPFFPETQVLATSSQYRRLYLGMVFRASVTLSYYIMHIFLGKGSVTSIRFYKEFVIPQKVRISCLCGEIQLGLTQIVPYSHGP